MIDKRKKAILYRVEAQHPDGEWEAIYLTYDRWRAEKVQAKHPDNSRITEADEWTDLCHAADRAKERAE